MSLRAEGWLMTPNLVTPGIDVSDRFSSYCVIDPAGDVVEEGRLRTTESALLSRFKDFTGRVVVEAGTHSPWISRVFADLGTEVVVANPRRVQLIAQSTRKNDKADAQTLARLGRIDPKLLTPITHRSAQAQAESAYIRSRSAMKIAAPPNEDVPRKDVPQHAPVQEAESSADGSGA